MTEQAQETPAEPTMQDIYSESGIQATAQEFNQEQPAVVPHTVVPVMPDPTLNPEGFQQYQAQQTAAQNHTVQQLQEQLGHVNNQLSQYENTRQQDVLKTDIDKAVTTLETHATGIDRGILLGQLHVRANDDPLFAQIWENRTQNPQALEKALGVIGADIKKTLPTVDPDVAEAQRALNNATTSMSTQPRDANTDLDGLGDQAFLNTMRSME